MVNLFDTVFVFGIEFLIAFSLSIGFCFSGQVRMQLPRWIGRLLFPIVRPQNGFRLASVLYNIYLIIIGFALVLAFAMSLLPANGDVLDLWQYSLIVGAIFFIGIETAVEGIQHIVCDNNWFGLFYKTVFSFFEIAFSVWLFRAILF